MIDKNSIPLTDKQASYEVGVAVQTLRNWRHQRKGPPYIKLGRSVRYRADDLIAYLKKHRIDPENI